MKNKILLCACLLAVVAGLFTSCKKDPDLQAIDSKLAQQTMLGNYFFIEVDSAAVSTTMHEWLLENGENGRVGYYRKATTGNGLDSDESNDLTWQEATMAENCLSMNIPVTVGGEQKMLSWSDGVLHVDGYTTEKSLISLANVLRSVNQSFTAYDFVVSDTTAYITSRMDTTYYLAWTTAVVSYTQEQIDAYKQFMIDNADTLKWFNETYPSRAVPDTVRFSTKQQADGTYKGQISVPFEDADIKEIKTNHGPLLAVNGEMVFNREGKANTGKYIYHVETWTEECYTKPTSKAAEHSELLIEITDAKWTPVSFVNVKKFNVAFKGKMHTKSLATVGGEVVEDKTDDIDDCFYEVALSGFNKEDGEVTHMERKYKNQ